MGGKATFLHTDIMKEEDIERVVKQTVDRFGRLDCMFNNAGIGGPGGPIDELPAWAFDVTVAVLFRAPFLGVKHAAAAMKRQGGGTIINTGSMAGLWPGWAGQVYTACKAAVIHFTWSVALQLGSSGIRVNCLCPGAIPTPIFARAVGFSQEAAEKTVEPLKKVFKDAQAWPRSALPEDVARAALWLASDDLSFVTGVALRVDGGLPNLTQSSELFARLFGTIGVPVEGMDIVIWSVRQEKSTMADGREAKIRRAYDEAINKGNLAALDEILAANVVRHVPSAPDIVGLESYKQAAANLRIEAPAPSQRVTVETGWLPRSWSAKVPTDTNNGDGG